MEDDWMIYTITLFAFSAVFFFCYVRKTFTFFEKNRISKASTPGFPFGNIYDVVFLNTPLFLQLWKYYGRFKRKQCALGGFYVFTQPAVVLVDAKVVKAALENDAFRILAAPESGLSATSTEDILENVLENFPGVWQDVLEALPSGEVNFTQVFQFFLKETAARAIFPEELQAEVESQILGKLERSGCKHFWKVLALCLPLWVRCLLCKSGKAPGSCVQFIQEVLVERKKDDLKEDDLIQILISEADAGEIGAILTSLVRNLEVSTNLILFCLYELSLNKEVQDELRGEIIRFKKQSRKMFLKDLNELTYLNTVVCETLRKYPLKPFLSWSCRSRYEENGVVIPKGVLVFASIFGLHHDAQNFVNPELFDPDRFSEENEKFVEPCTYLPYGDLSNDHFISRYCNLAMKISLLELLSKVKFSLGSKSMKALTFEESIFELRPKDEMWLKCEKIKS